MIVKVRMSAFSETNYDAPFPIREVEIPDEEWNINSDEQRRELVFHYGQNEIQSKEYWYSVSCGDVMELDGELVLICGIGFEVITEEQYRKLCRMSVSDRQFYVLQRVMS